MPPNNNPPARGDHLAEMLSLGKAPSLDALLDLCPDEPLLAVERYPEDAMTDEEALRLTYEDTRPDRDGLIKTSRGTYIVVHHKWTKRQLELARRFPGLQLDYRFREVRKYFLPHSLSAGGSENCSPPRKCTGRVRSSVTPTEGPSRRGPSTTPACSSEIGCPVI